MFKRKIVGFQKWKWMLCFLMSHLLVVRPFSRYIHNTFSTLGFLNLEAKLWWENDGRAGGRDFKRFEHNSSTVLPFQSITVHILACLGCFENKSSLPVTFYHFSPGSSSHGDFLTAFTTLDLLGLQFCCLSNLYYTQARFTHPCQWN